MGPQGNPTPANHPLAWDPSPRSALYSGLFQAVLAPPLTGSVLLGSSKPGGFGRGRSHVTLIGLLSLRPNSPHANYGSARRQLQLTCAGTRWERGVSTEGLSPRGRGGPHG
jgi:hypothetical protein